MKLHHDGVQRGRRQAPRVIDALIVADCGADWGAFGAGVLNGAGDPALRRPRRVDM